MKTFNLEKVIYKKYTGKLRVKNRPKYPWANKFLLALFDKITEKKAALLFKSKPEYLPLFKEMSTAAAAGGLKIRREGWNAVHLYHERQDFIQKFIDTFSNNCEEHHVVANDAVAQAITSNRKLVVKKNLPKKKYRYKIKLKTFRLGSQWAATNYEEHDELIANIVENYGDVVGINYDIMRWYRETKFIPVPANRSQYGYFIWNGYIYTEDSEHLTVLLFMLGGLVHEVEEYKTLEEFNETTISGNPTTTEPA